MKRIRTFAMVLCLGADCASVGLVRAADGAVAPAPVPAAPAATAPMDPAIKALLIGLAASVLQGMAANSGEGMKDPGAAIGNTLQGLLASPETARLADGVLAQLLNETPAELQIGRAHV